MMFIHKISIYWLRIHCCYFVIATICFSMTILFTVFYWEDMKLTSCTNALLQMESEQPFQFPFHENPDALLQMESEEPFQFPFHNPGDPITIRCNRGRLGNQMCTIATLYGLSKLNRRNAATLPCNYNRLETIFDINVPLINATAFAEKNPWSVSPYLRSRDHFIDENTNIIKGYNFPCSYTFFHHAQSDIRKIFRFKDDVRSYVIEALRRFRKANDVVIVGVHVRRTDFLFGKEPWLLANSRQGREVDMEYFQKATSYFRKRYDRVTFVAVSDDRVWCREHLEQFGIEVLPDSPGPAYDMATMASCDHLIMTYGTFAFWAGYLSGGTVVYFDKFLKPGTRFTTKEFIFEKMYPPEWIGITTNSSYKYD